MYPKQNGLDQSAKGIMFTRTVQRIERGEQASLDTLSEIAPVFDVSVTALRAPPISDTPSDEGADNRLADAQQSVAREFDFYRSVTVWVLVSIVLGVADWLADRRRQRLQKVLRKMLR